jgi:hypothetical protein
MQRHNPSEPSPEHALLLDGSDVIAYEKHYKLFLLFWTARSKHLNPSFFSKIENNNAKTEGYSKMVVDNL